MIQLACSRLVQVVHCTDKCPVQLWDWPVDNSNKNILEVYLFYIVFGSGDLFSSSSHQFNALSTFLCTVHIMSVATKEYIKNSGYTRSEKFFSISCCALWHLFTFFLTTFANLRKKHFETPPEAKLYKILQKFHEIFCNFAKFYKANIYPETLRGNFFQIVTNFVTILLSFERKNVQKLWGNMS